MKTVLGPFDRKRTAIGYDPDKGLTHQSFKDECDINNVVASYTRTGIMPVFRQGEPQFGDAPESTLFEAACAQAAIRSAEEEGFEWPESPSEAPESPIAEQEGDTPSPETAPEEPSQAADGESSGQNNSSA